MATTKNWHWLDASSHSWYRMFSQVCNSEQTSNLHRIQQLSFTVIHIWSKVSSDLHVKATLRSRGQSCLMAPCRSIVDNCHVWMLTSSNDGVPKSTSCHSLWLRLDITAEYNTSSMLSVRWVQQWHCRWIKKHCKLLVDACQSSWQTSTRHSPWQSVYMHQISQLAS